MEDKNSGENAVIRKVGVDGIGVRQSQEWEFAWEKPGWREISKWKTCEGHKSHRCGRGLRWGLHLSHCRELHLGLGLSGTGWGGTLGWGWDRGREGGGGAATGGLGVRPVSGPPRRGGRGGCRRWCGVQGVLGGG